LGKSNLRVGKTDESLITKSIFLIVYSSVIAVSSKQLLNRKGVEADDNGEYDDEAKDENRVIVGEMEVIEDEEEGEDIEYEEFPRSD